jgi:7-carboxy-7-deazaguanine synthase
VSRYLINEIFHSLQGEGVRAGIAHVFVRFAKCNLTCNVAEHGFDCDTDFEHGQWHTLDQLVAALPPCPWVLLTGGEPTLQLDLPLVLALSKDRRIAIETNGTRFLPIRLNWVCVSPKPGSNVVLKVADEVKCVVQAGQTPDPMGVRSPHYLISPAFKGDELDPDALAWCIDWVKANPRWRLSCQQHKWWGVR